jgi:hypothetical protein
MKIKSPLGSQKTNPIQTQNKPNSRKARMNVSLAITRNYNNEQRTMNNELLCKTNPNKADFNTKIAGLKPNYRYNS